MKNFKVVESSVWMPWLGRENRRPEVDELEIVPGEVYFESISDEIGKAKGERFREIGDPFKAHLIRLGYVAHSQGGGKQEYEIRDCEFIPEGTPAIPRSIHFGHELGKVALPGAIDERTYLITTGEQEELEPLRLHAWDKW